MNDKLTKITLTFPMRYDRPNRNGTVFTKEAIENAFGSSPLAMPILINPDESSIFTYRNEHCIGMTTPTYYFDYDEDNKVCEVTIEGRLFNVGPTIRINEMQDGKITDFDIMSIGIVKKEEHNGQTI